MSAMWRIAGGFLICKALFFIFSNFLLFAYETPYFPGYLCLWNTHVRIRKYECSMSEAYEIPVKRTILILGKRIPVPKSVAMRRTLGGALVLGGALGFLPILGFWMLPLGLVVLSNDSHRVRRWRRKSEVKILRKWRNRN